ncbi:MAG: hypothetical protein ACREPI_05720 [Candidatus Dormibacterales bacterium]
MEIRELEVDPMAAQTLRWYGWGSPVGMGLFVLLLSASAALVRLALR